MGANPAVTTPQRSCEHCAHALPPDADVRQRYCDHACRSAAYRARKAATPTHPAMARVAELTELLTAAETRVGQLTASNRRKSEQIMSLARRLADDRRSAARAIRGQAERTVTVREDRDALATELSALNRSWTLAGLPADITPAYVANLKEQLATRTRQYDELVVRHQRLTAAAELAATERKHLQEVVRQWDTLCRRLAKAVTGRPVTAVDKRILATHARFRSAVAAADRSRTKAGGRP